MGRNLESRSRRHLRRTIYGSGALAALGVCTATVSAVNAESTPVPAYASPFTVENNLPKVSVTLNTEPTKPTASVTLFEKPKTETPITTKPSTTTTTRSIDQPRTKSPNTTERSPGQSWVGTASYYSREQCLGCDKNRIMANGQSLDDSAITVAFNRAELNTKVKVTNLSNGKEVVAKVTDTGGFEKYGKIIDLNLGTKNALGCADTCSVRIVTA